MKKFTFWYFFRISRPLNVLIAGLTFALAAYVSFERSFEFLSSKLFWYEGGLMLFIMATGYWINDVFDYKIDFINKPQRAVVGRFISSKKILTGYFVAVFCLALATAILPVKYILINLGAIAALYFYAQRFKREAIIGNLIVATLTAMVVLAGALLFHLKIALLWGMIFAFLITFIREVTKDLEDMRGDLQFNLRTLPIQIGIRSAKRFLLFCYLIFLIATLLPVAVRYQLSYEFLDNYLIVSLLLVHLPTYASMFLLARSSRARHFRLQSHLLKAIIIGGLASILLLR